MRICLIFNLAYRLPPGTTLLMGSVSIGSRPPFEPTSASPIRLRSDAATWVMGHPQVTEFKTGTYCWLTYEAPDVDLALRHAYSNLLPGVTFALSYMAGFNIRSNFLCAYNADTGENVTDRRSPTYQEVTVHVPDESFAHAVLEILHSDPTFQRACKFLDQARRLWDTASTVDEVEPTLRDMSILHYAKTIECLANDERVNRQTDGGDTLQREQERVVTLLAKTLDSKRSLGRKIGAISEAQTRLNRAGNRYLDLKMGRLSEELDLQPGWLHRAKELTAVRNRNIAHAGTLLTTAERQALFREEEDGRPAVDELAETAVVGFMFRYLLDLGRPPPERGCSYTPAPGAAVHLHW